MYTRLKRTLTLMMSAAATTALLGMYSGSLQQTVSASRAANKLHAQSFADHNKNTTTNSCNPMNKYHSTLGGLFPFAKDFDTNVPFNCNLTGPLSDNWKTAPAAPDGWYVQEVEGIAAANTAALCPRVVTGKSCDSFFTRVCILPIAPKVPLPRYCPIDPKNPSHTTQMNGCAICGQVYTHERP